MLGVGALAGCSGGGALVEGGLQWVLWWGCSGGGPEEPKKAQKWSKEHSETVWDEEALVQDLAGPVVKMRFFGTEKRSFWVTLRFPKESSRTGGMLWRGCSGGSALVGVLWRGSL